MSGLLSAEELSALHEPYADAKKQERAVTPAVFPSVSQLDADRSAALDLAMKRWMELLSKDLAGHLRVSCAAAAPRQCVAARRLLPGSDEAAFWGQVEGFPEARILVSLPLGFAAAVCERVFGAPLALRPARRLSRAENLLLRESAHTWFTHLTKVLGRPPIRMCRAGEVEDDPSAEDGGNWMQLTCVLQCGGVEGSFSLSMAPETARILLGENPQGDAAPPTPRRLVESVGDVPVLLRAILGHADLTLDELSNLQIGDIIALERRTVDPVEVVISDHTVFLARAGRAGQMVAFELIEQIGEATNLSMETMAGQRPIMQEALKAGAEQPKPGDAAGAAAAACLAGAPFANTMDFLLDVRLTVSVEVGRVQMPVRQVMALAPGSVIELPRSASEPVEVYANGRCIGRGEIVVVGDQFGVRVTEIGS